MTDAPKTKSTPQTPLGTWPLFISGALLLLTTPAYLLAEVVPQWLAVVGAVLFVVAAAGALVWSFVTYRQTRARRSRGVPIAGVAVGVLALLVAVVFILPAALA